MSLSPGAKLGPYEILSPLGAGGVSSVDPILLSADGRSDVYSYRRLLPEPFVVDGLM